MSLDRRDFLRKLAIAGVAAAAEPLIQWNAGAATSPSRFAPSAPGSFDFVFFTDTHIEPELNAAQGCDMCFRKIAGLKAEFAIVGGDHVYDAAGVGGARAKQVFDLYKRTEQQLEMPLHHAIGNHDIFGVLTKSGVAPSDPAYGKRMFEDRLGARTYYSWDHKGYHFVVLDSIQPTEDRLWEARVNAAQLQWLAEDLGKLAAQTPVIVTIHCPLVTAFATYAQVVTADRKYNTLTVTNALEVLEVFEKANVVAVLQGHTHINEVVSYKGMQFVTSGAVCGNWWHGPRMGTPEGFTVVSLRDGKISTRYETYGFHSIDIREKF